MSGTFKSSLYSGADRCACSNWKSNSACISVGLTRGHRLRHSLGLWALGLGVGLGAWGLGLGIRLRRALVCAQDQPQARRQGQGAQF